MAMGASRIVLGRPRTAAVGLAGAAYAVLASFTHPFTWGADVVTAAPLVVAVTIALRSTRRRDRSDAGSAGAATGSTRGSRGALWLLPILAAVGWELYCYASLPRSAHPTFSSLLDIVDATRGGKIACFAAWLVLGWWLVTS
jgi:hypothetical protein